MTATFVTSTGTDIGKTFVMRGLIEHFRRQGGPVDAIKPIATGFDMAEVEGSDTGLLATALGRNLTEADLDRISPWRFAPPYSPDLAARLEQRPIDFSSVVTFCSEAVARHRGTLLIEGIGGIMVPLDDRHTVLDWMCALHLPLVLVTGSYLGTISHTLTALDVLRRRELTIAALVISESANSGVSTEDTARIIGQFAGDLPLVTLPRVDTPSHPAFAGIARYL